MKRQGCPFPRYSMENHLSLSLGSQALEFHGWPKYWRHSDTMTAWPSFKCYPEMMPKKPKANNYHHNLSHSVIGRTFLGAEWAVIWEKRMVLQSKFILFYKKNPKTHYIVLIFFTLPLTAYDLILSWPRSKGWCLGRAGIMERILFGSQTDLASNPGFYTWPWAIQMVSLRLSLWSGLGGLQEIVLIKYPWAPGEHLVRACSWFLSALSSFPPLCTIIIE